MNIKFQTPILQSYDPADRFWFQRLPFVADGVSGVVEIYGGSRKVHIFQNLENLDEISSKVLSQFSKEYD